jgi:hypothetical protein
MLATVRYPGAGGATQPWIEFDNGRMPVSRKPEGASAVIQNRLNDAS